jgi:uncharacterized membrane protein YedE/YeeE
MEKKTKYMNPYLAGFLLGVLIVVSIYITGDGLGASGAVKALVVETVDVVAPTKAESMQYIKKYNDAHPEGPLKTWLIFEIIGVAIGAFVSGLISERIGFKIDKGEKISNKTRLIAALIGGALFGMGSQFARGCTSGAALSGMAVYSVAGFLTFLMIFGTSYAIAYFFRKLWL